jgi:hypothetical protein
MRKKAILLLASVLTASLPVSAQTHIDSLTQRAETRAESLNAQFELFTTRVQRADSLQRVAEGELEALESAPAPRGEDALQARVDEIEKQLGSISQQERDKLRERYNLGREVLSEMSDGVTVISFMHMLVDVEQGLNRVTNLWSDSTFRNWADRVQDWGTIGGALVGTLSLFSDQIGIDDDQTLGFGAATLLVSQAAGTIWGQEAGSKVHDKMQILEVSRRAYDDLMIRSATLEEYISANQSLRGQIDSLRRNYATMDTAAAIAHVVALLDDFERVLHQIPIYIESIRTAALIYSQSYNSRDPRQVVQECGQRRGQVRDLADALCGIIEKTDRVYSEYFEKVMPIFLISPQVVQTLTSS